MKTMFLNELPPTHLQVSDSRFTHFLFLSMAMFIAVSLGALWWMSRTPTDVVVRAPGECRGADASLATSAGRPLNVNVVTDGAVKTISVAPSDHVRTDEILVQLDTSFLDNAIEQHSITIASLNDEIASLARSRQLLAAQFETEQNRIEAELAAEIYNVEVAKRKRRHEIELTENELLEARHHLQQVEKLFEKGAATENEVLSPQLRVQDAESALKNARTDVNELHIRVLENSLAVARSQHEVNRELLARDLSRKRKELENSGLQLTSLQRQREQMEVRAPMDGVVTEVTLRAGDYVSPGNLGIVISACEQYTFEALVSGRDMADIRPGQRALIELDHRDRRRDALLNGEVVHIGPDAMDHSRPGEAPTAQYTVIIRIDREQFPPGSGARQMVLGMAGTAEIVVEHKSVLMIVGDWLADAVYAD